MAAQVVSGHLEMPGHLEMTSSQSHIETDESGARARRRAEEAEVADRGTPPKRPPPAAGSEGHLEMLGHLEMAQGGEEAANADETERARRDMESEGRRCAAELADGKLRAAWRLEERGGPKADTWKVRQQDRQTGRKRGRGECQTDREET